MAQIRRSESRVNDLSVLSHQHRPCPHLCLTVLLGAPPSWCPLAEGLEPGLRQGKAIFYAGSVGLACYLPLEIPAHAVWL